MVNSLLSTQHLRNNLQMILMKLKYCIQDLLIVLILLEEIYMNVLLSFERWKTLGKYDWLIPKLLEPQRTMNKFIMLKYLIERVIGWIMPNE